MIDLKFRFRLFAIKAKLWFYVATGRIKVSDRAAVEAFAFLILLFRLADEAHQKELLKVGK